MPLLVSRICVKCNIEFYVPPSVLNRQGRGRFCSHACSMLFNSVKWDRNGDKNSNWKGGISDPRKQRYIRKYPEREKARREVKKALRNGIIKRLPCEICGEIKSQAHHDDYIKPLDIRWLCDGHHKLADKERRDKAKDTNFVKYNQKIA